MTEPQYDQPPDPTGAASVAELIERLKALQSWAGQPPAGQLRPLGATGSVEAFVAACLRARQWSPEEVDREVARWHASLRALTSKPAAVPPPSGSPPPVAEPADTPDPVAEPAAEPADTPHLVAEPADAPGEAAEAAESPAEVGCTPEEDAVTQELARILDPAEAAPPPAAGDGTPALDSSTVTLPHAGTPGRAVAARRRRIRRRITRRRLAVGATLAAALLLITVPALLIRSSGSPPPPVASAPATTGPQAPAGTGTPGPQPPAGGAAARALSPSTPSPAGQPDPPGGQPDPPRPTEEREDEPPPDGEDEPPAGDDWSTVVDNTTSGRFRASGNWRTQSGSGQRGSNFRYASPQETSDPAWYRVDIPETGRYRVDVWFPARSGYNERTPYIVATTGGHQTIHISQRRNGGRWVSLGTFTLAAGDAEVVAVSRWRVSGTGYVIADAIRVTRV